MLELMLCSALTVLPDYLFRRFVQGKRIGREITNPDRACMNLPHLLS